ncbi:cytochrome c biogenesis protein DipZ [Gordonia sp. (in: high G+C Gram-positive bacteria)]|uniref:cytochrome c biogenesis protein DipZ n=1 Tax=Gordonia sp. (in: high G+C Gram-positive bacteria) TaxID=84139 RepID=UPI0016BAF07C|nr:cytochrome c biogenesis protein DipZ [Gordonia sp. (in: high G+C Gram-positive bacteria)]NLG46112.1 cytochrome c biogenesis protein DipZ [Gordonia sp. (in: high G+C Gram-positive bacteria)]
MNTVIVIGFIGGLITGISPCILPVLPVLFLSGAQSARDNDDAPDPASSSRRARFSESARPYLVIAGLVVSFSIVTLVGSSLLSLVRLPQDSIRWFGLVALTAIGLGLIFPKVEEWLEKPFSRLPQRPVGQRRSGFGLGLALGVLYVPCAGPVLAAIVVAGATGEIGISTVVLTLSFAIGATLPLLIFALAGRRVAERVAAFRRRQRQIRVVGGVVMIALAIGLVFDVPGALQRAIPDYTSALQESVDGADDLNNKLSLGGIVTDENRELSKCTDGAPDLQSCGTAPKLTGITDWFNTPDNAALSLSQLRGRVVLIDFWAYSCINCQRSIPHVVDWYDTYRDAGLEVIGVHTPEYAFEKVPSNVTAAASRLGIEYPIALDPAFSTWTNYRNSYWPAQYLIDASGTVRHIEFGEGGYAQSERMIRELLTDARPGVALPAPTEKADTTPTESTTAETYLGVGKMVNYGGAAPYRAGTADFAFPADQRPDTFALRGRWSLDYQGARAERDATIALNYHAKNVFIVVGGAGTLTVRSNGSTSTKQISGPPTLHQIVAKPDNGSGRVEVTVSPGLQVFSFTYG